LILVNGPVIKPEHIRFEAVTDAEAMPEFQQPRIDSDQTTALRGSLRETECDLILGALGSGASRREAADRLGISPRTLRYKLARLRASGIDVPAA
jgi:two-component system response regulator FlrC